MTPEEEAMLLNELLSPRTAAPDPAAFAPGPFVDEVAPQIHGPGDRGSFFERYNTAQGPRGWQVHGDPFERGQGFVAPLALLAGFLNARGRQAGQERTETNAIDARARTQAAERNKANLEISRENRQFESRRMERLETARLARDTAKQGRADTKAEDDAARIYTLPASLLKRLGMPELAGEKLTRKEYLDLMGKSAPKEARDEPIVAIEGPSGPVYVGRSQALGKAPPKPAGAQAGKLPSAAERASLAADVSAIEQSRRIKALYRPEFVGPLTGRRGQLATTTGKGLKGGESDFRAAIAQYRNAVISTLSGAAVSESEAKRLREQIPQETDPSQVFEAKLRQTETNLRNVAMRRRDTFSQTGLDLGGLSALPAPDLRQFVRP